MTKAKKSFIEGIITIMITRNPFAEFFKKRKEGAEENLRKMSEFKQKFIMGPIEEIPQKADEDLFKARREAMRTFKKVKDTKRKITEFERKHSIR